ncbi:MAG: efflux RND transporter periplasmic adaptor subunit [Desulfovibrio sp.]|jgi:membrane fusion protein (multidrug efflux system)|nr:efflux RND transporter periplasmic adaptor subunit [Desulfovibrio sp.]
MFKNSRVKIFIVLLFTVFICAGCENRKAPQSENPLVRYSVIKNERVVLKTELPGRVSATMSAPVRPQVTGIIMKRLFEEGSDISAGQILYEIEPDVFEAAYKNAAAQFAVAEADEFSARLLAERYGKIIKSNAVSKQEYDDAFSARMQAGAAVEAARQGLESARINLSYTKVTAPVQGRIGRSFVTPGALVTAGQAQPLAVIQNLDTVYVDVSRSNAELMRLRTALAENAAPEQNAGAKVGLRLEDGTPYARLSAAKDGNGGAEELFGELLFSDITIGRSTGSVNIRVKFPNPDKALLPGMHVRAVFEEAVLEEAVLVPQKSVFRDAGGKACVYVLEKDEAPGTAEDNFKTILRQVEIQRNIGNRWLLASGLKPGERVLVEGHLKIRPGRAVSGQELSPAPSEPAGTPAPARADNNKAVQR